MTGHDHNGEGIADCLAPDQAHIIPTRWTSNFLGRHATRGLDYCASVLWRGLYHGESARRKVHSVRPRRLILAEYCETESPMRPGQYLLNIRVSRKATAKFNDGTCRWHRGNEAALVARQCLVFCSSATKQHFQSCPTAFRRLHHDRPQEQAQLRSLGALWLVNEQREVATMLQLTALRMSCKQTRDCGVEPPFTCLRFAVVDLPAIRLVLFYEFCYQSCRPLIRPDHSTWYHSELSLPVYSLPPC